MTKKSNLLNHLEQLNSDASESSDKQKFDVSLIDGGLLIHSFLSASERTGPYSTLARNLLTFVCKNFDGQEIHVLFDTYKEESLKVTERKRRGEVESHYIIATPEQNLKQSYDKLLRSSSFRQALIKFLQDEWQKDQYHACFQGKTLYVSIGGSCIKLKPQEDDRVEVTWPDTLQGEHEEADTLIAFHANQVCYNHILFALKLFALNYNIVVIQRLAN